MVPNSTVCTNKNNCAPSGMCHMLGRDKGRDICLNKVLVAHTVAGMSVASLLDYQTTAGSVV